MAERTTEEVAQIFTNAGDSVTLINKIAAQDTITDEDKETLDRNVRHLEIIKAYKRRWYYLYLDYGRFYCTGYSCNFREVEILKYIYLEQIFQNQMLFTSNLLQLGYHHINQWLFLRVIWRLLKT